MNTGRSYALNCGPKADYQILVCPSKLDAIAAEEDGLRIAVILSHQRHCFLHMAGVASIDSTGIGYLIGLQKKLQSAGRQLVLIAPSTSVCHALKLMRISEFFSSVPDLASAQYLVQVRAREQSAAVTLRTAAAVTPLVWHGEITAANATEVWENTRPHLEALRPDRELALDLSDVRFIDSSGLSLMIRAKKLARQQGANLVFKGIQPAVQNVIRIARLEGFLQSDNATDPKPLPGRAPTWREVLSLPETGASPASMFAPSHDAILQEPVTNAVLATSHE